MKRILILLFAIVLVATTLRFWNLGNVPSSPDWDEAALGYNAYSIWQTGKDEYGQRFPIVLRSFDDYKPALYAYFVIPSIALFDLTVFAVRLPSAIFGVLTVLGSFFLVRELFKRNDLALISSFLLAISPWHIQFSRIAFEANLGVMLNVYGILFFLLGLRKNSFLIASAILLSLNLYAYQSEKVFIPLLALALFVIIRRELLAIPKKYLFTAIFLGAIIVLPIFYYTVTNSEALSRARGVSVFADTTPFLKENVERYAIDIKNNDYIGIIFDNRRVEFAKAIVAGYLSHFDLNWLFIRGDIARHHAPNMALMYLWELPFLLIGIYTFIFGKFSRKTKLFILTWFLITPIPASITSGVPHSIRTLNFLPTFQIFTAIGLLFAAQKISNLKSGHSFGIQISNLPIKYPIFFFILSFSILNFLYYLNQYFVQQNYFHSQHWQYGYKEAIFKIKEIEGKYKKIVVSNEPHLDQSYIFFLFYLKYPPQVYQQEAKSVSGGFRETHRFGKYDFRPINWNTESKEKGTLYIGRPFDFPQNDQGHVKTINFLDGTAAIKLVET